MCVCYEELFSKTRLAPLQWVSNVNATFKDSVLGKCSSEICTYICICDELFSKAQYTNLASTLETLFKWYLLRFGIELFIYSYSVVPEFAAGPYARCQAQLYM